MSEFSVAFAEVKRKVQPDAEPPLTYGTGTSPDLDLELDQIIESHKIPAWAAATAYAYGDEVLPVARNGRKYACITPGTSGASAPTWSVEPYAQVADGSVVWQEAGLCSGAYNVRAAVFEALSLHETKAAEYGARDEGGMAERWRKAAERYRPVGAA